MMPTISVIVPVYKVEPYLHRCVDSILNQTYTDFELILVDDGSPDSCPALCDEYAVQDSRVHVIHQQNGGLSAARNRGLEAASGKYIYFVDSDDWIAYNLLETVVPWMDNGNDMVFFGYYNCPDGVVSGRVSFGTPGDILFENEKECARFLAKELAFFRIGWSVWSRIFRRDIIERYHIRFADNRKIFAEDLYFSLCYCSHVQKIKCMDIPLYYYLIRGDSIMGAQSAALNAGRMNELSKEVLQHFTAQKADPSFFEVFPLIHYEILDGVIKKFRRIEGISYKEMRALLLKDIPDFTYFQAWERKLSRCKKLLQQSCSPAECRIMLLTAKYYANGKWLTQLALEINEKWMPWANRIHRFKELGLQKSLMRIAEKMANRGFH